MTGFRIRVKGVVQGVGFRPYVWHLAQSLNLQGWVCNDAEGVLITVNGPQSALFLERLPRELPPLARITSLTSEPAVIADFSGFHIIETPAPLGRRLSARIGADAPPCLACLDELSDPSSRRWRYAFTTCTHCGPRYTVSRALPWDRPQTTLADFPLCPDCQHEYSTPSDRRFHAETLACPSCGPRLQLVNLQGQPLSDEDPIRATLSRLQAGEMIAIKGIGGFHLACDARQTAAIDRLRQRKQRDSKPLAIMALNTASLDGIVALSEADQPLLNHPSRPIVLAEKIEPTRLPETLAPHLAWQGVMLPASPLHYLLWHEAAGRPTGTHWLSTAHPLLLVMTSANPHGEPLVKDNEEALHRLADIADAVLWHDRPIEARADDSVIRVAAPNLPLRTSFLRRGRGFVPDAIPLASSTSPKTLLALGGDMKNTVCLLKENEAILSTHIGTLDNIATRQFQLESIERLLKLHEAHVDVVIHDQHPGFASTEQAFQLAATWRCPTQGIYHHAAHVAAVAAEHGLTGTVIGLALDGVGYGEDGEAWGGELLRLTESQVERLGHLSPLPLPGGDRAAREPWRMALAASFTAGFPLANLLAQLQHRFPEQSFGPLLTLLKKNLRCPQTTSLGRWFDAAAGLLGLCSHNQYEGEAAMRLESLAIRHRQTHGPASPWRDAWRIPMETTEQAVPGPDFSPLVAYLLESEALMTAAASFHATLAAAFENWLLRAVDRESRANPAQKPALVLSGGCTVNRTLFEPLRQALIDRGLSVYEAQAVPSGDGGLALGQVWLAARHLTHSTAVA